MMCMAKKIKSNHERTLELEAETAALGKQLTLLLGLDELKKYVDKLIINPAEIEIKPVLRKSKII